MPRLSRNALSAAMVRSAGPGNYVDGNGLMLRVRKSGSRQWVQRLTIHGRRVDLGLGSAELVKLADARKVAADNRAIARTGGDPRRSRVPTFAKAEAACFAERREVWRTGGAQHWRGPMDRYVLPKLGAMPVDKVGSAAVYEVLRPIALAGKHATVKMAGTAITAVLEWARIAEFRAEGSPVETVRRRLPKRAGGPKHYDALHFSEVAGALARIDATNCAPSTKRAIRFTALTASRQVEVRRATWCCFADCLITDFPDCFARWVRGFPTVFGDRRKVGRLAGCRTAVGASSRFAAPALRSGPSGDPPPSARRSASMAVSAAFGHGPIARRMVVAGA